MKIIAEFNSNEELLSFVNTFGATALQPTNIEVPAPKKEIEVPKEEKKSKKSTKEKVKEEPKKDEEVETPKEEVTEDPKEEAPEQPTTEETSKEEKAISKEEVRAVFTKLLKAGKGKEAKELTAKYGASKLGELKEEDYAAVLKEAEELM